jgi:hypothetical protein
MAPALCGGCRAKGRTTATGAATGWRVGAKPTVVIGASDSSAATSLDRVAGAAILSDGRIVVTDGALGRSRVSVFSPEGRYISTLGGPGDGPGEFRWTWGVQAGPHDSVFVWDKAPQRLTVFTSGGRLARTAQLLIGGSLAGTQGLDHVTRLRDGTWVGLGYQDIVPTAPGEIRRDTIPIGLFDGALHGFRRIARLPGLMSAESRSGDGPPPFSPSALDAAWGRCVFTSTGDTPSIAAYSSAGKLVTSIHGPGEGRPVTQADIDTLLAYRLRLSRTARDSTFVRQSLREGARTDSLPYYHQIIADEWGQLWLEKYEPPLGMGTLWYVVSQSGGEVGTVRLPTVTWVFSITHKGILGSTHNALGEERVELFPFVGMPTGHPDPLSQCVPGG